MCFFNKKQKKTAIVGNLVPVVRGIKRAVIFKHSTGTLGHIILPTYYFPTSPSSLFYSLHEISHISAVNSKPTLLQ